MPDDTRTFQLSSPVAAYGEQVSAVTLRRPTVKELRECGQPYTVAVGGGGGIKADYEACARLLTMICTPPLPASAVDSLDAGDFDDMAMTLVGFTKGGPRGAASGSTPAA